MQCHKPQEVEMEVEGEEKEEEEDEVPPSPAVTGMMDSKQTLLSLLASQFLILAACAEDLDD